MGVRKSIAVLTLLLAGAAAGTCADKAAERIHISGVSDAGKVSEFLYRGSQPSDEGIRQLKVLGIDTIVDLRGERHGLSQHEEKMAGSEGIHFVNIPGSGWSPPTDDQMAEFFSLVSKRPRQKIFVHCWFGSDRSGVFIAAYRIAFDGWTPEQAIGEMHDFHFKAFWHPVMKAYVRGFPDRLAHSPKLERYRHRAPQE